MFIQILNVIGYIVLYYIVFIITLFVHELGHKYLLSSYNGYNTKIKFYFRSYKDFGFEVGKKGDYIFLTKHQQVNVYGVGVAVGILVILVFTLLFNQVLLLLLLIPYLFGCRSDIKQIIYILRKEKLEWEY